MKTIPILFQKEMIQANHRGQKKETRRTTGLKKYNEDPERYLFWGFKEETGTVTVDDLEELESHELKFPYGNVGDVLWVRETWAETTNIECKDDSNWPNRPSVITEKEDDIVYSAIIYAADGPWQWLDEDGGFTEKSYWKPSIFMPKEACRTFLKIKNIQVERLNDLTDKDAFNEGVSYTELKGLKRYCNYCFGKKWDRNAGTFGKPKASFVSLWESINGPDSWGKNPWVWVIKYEETTMPDSFI